ncbi:hypothetical protein ACJ5NV_06280 [Loktanella agnita]|uniref:hypothetical protein n=1 Tax=Loktanella agnita TaxID=287097 RepID=UPI0039868B59
MKSIAIICLSTLALVSCSGSIDGTPPPVTGAERALVVPVNGVNLRVQYDPTDAAGAAILTYADPVPSMFGWLNINRDIIPAVERATGCDVVGAAPTDNQIMGDMGITRIPLSC